jgi:hypothetical protein
MSDEIVPRPLARGRGRLFRPGQSGNPAGRRRRDNSSEGLIQPKGEILLQIFCRCRKPNRAVQFMVDGAKSGAGSPTARRQSANRRRGAIRGRPNPASGPRHARRPRRRADAPVAGSDAPREPPAGRPPRATNQLLAGRRSVQTELSSGIGAQPPCLAMKASVASAQRSAWLAATW